MLRGAANTSAIVTATSAAQRPLLVQLWRCPLAIFMFVWKTNDSKQTKWRERCVCDNAWQAKSFVCVCAKKKEKKWQVFCLKLWRHNPQTATSKSFLALTQRRKSIFASDRKGKGE